MDFVEWADTVLRTLVELARKIDGGQTVGVHETQLAARLFGSDATAGGFHGSTQREAMFDVLLSLEAAGLIQGTQKQWCTVTREGRAHAADPLPFWQQVCTEALDPEEDELLRLINRLSPDATDSYVRLRRVTYQAAAGELDWPNAIAKAHEWAKALAEAGFIQRRGLDLVPAYKGLVWETRRAFTVQAALIDHLVAEWETTSVDHKQELKLRSKDQKAEFVKDVIGLANTLASGRRWLVIGFENKNRTYYGPPDPKITQDRLEQIIQQYVRPFVNIRYDAVDHRLGKVGLVEILPDRAMLPYSVSKSLKGEKQEIREGDLWVRHGSHSAKPDGDEVRTLHEEAARARETRTAGATTSDPGHLAEALG